MTKDAKYWEKIKEGVDFTDEILAQLTPEQKRNQAWLAAQVVQARDDGGLPVGEALDAATERHRACTARARLRTPDRGGDDLTAAVHHPLAAALNTPRAAPRTAKENPPASHMADARRSVAPIKRSRPILSRSRESSSPYQRAP